VSGASDVSERVERMQDLKELLKYERQHHAFALIDDPTSIETHLLALSIAAMERELNELERGAT
jgi:hypothetical protein